MRKLHLIRHHEIGKTLTLLGAKSALGNVASWRADGAIAGQRASPGDYLV